MTRLIHGSARAALPALALAVALALGAQQARAQTSPFEDPATDLGPETGPSGPQGVPAEDSAPAEDDFADFLPDLAPETGPDDPLEDINRPIFNVNIALDRWVMRPVTRMYMEAPEPARRGLGNMLDNLDNPVIFANDILQGEMSRAGATFGRFFINSIFGVFGFFDLADAMGLPGHREDFGQTLASYGVPAGPYLVLPLFGPSNLRDLAGRIFDTTIDPSNSLTAGAIPDNMSTGVTMISFVDTRQNTIDETENLEATSLDFYAAVRSLYHQNREFEILNGRPAPEPEMPESETNGR